MIKNLLIILLLPVFSTEVTSAQTTFQKTVGGTGSELGSSVQQTNDGGYIIAGNTWSFGAGFSDAYLIRTNANGDTLWTKTYGGADEDVVTSVTQTTDGGFILTGSTKSFGAGFQDVYLIKTDGNGDLLWSKTYGGALSDEGLSAQQTSDGGYIIAGYTVSFGAGSNDFYLVKTNAVGDLLWTKTYGGIYVEWCNSVEQTVDAGYVISGYASSFGAGSDDIYLVKTDSMGNLLWSKTYGGPNADEGAFARQTSDGGYIIGGWSWNFASGGKNVYIIKTDNSGDTLWSKIYDTGDDESAYSVQETTDGGYIITSNLFFLKTGSNGNVLWTKHYGGTGDGIISSQEASDGGYIITGRKDMGASEYNIYFIKTDNNGTSGCTENNVIISNTLSVATQVTTVSTTVTSGGTVTSPATLVGSGGTLSTLCIHVGVNEIANESSVLIYPNPSEGNFFIALGRTIMRGDVEVLNTLGESVFIDNISNESTKEIHTKGISAGIYFLRVFDGENQSITKLIIE